MTTENGQTAKELYVAELRSQIERLQAVLAMVESGGESLAAGNGAPSASRPKETQVRPDSFFGMKMPGAVRKFLEMCGKGNPQTTQAIAEALIAGGLDPRANIETLRKNVYTVFQRGKDDFVKIGKVWGLAEWYPSKPKGDETKPKAKKGKGRAKRANASSAAPQTAAAQKSGYKKFLTDALTSGKTMAEAAAEWRKQANGGAMTTKISD